jgi:hypothetical protein
MPLDLGRLLALSIWYAPYAIEFGALFVLGKLALSNQRLAASGFRTARRMFVELARRRTLQSSHGRGTGGARACSGAADPPTIVTGYSYFWRRIRSRPAALQPYPSNVAFQHAHPQHLCTAMHHAAQRRDTGTVVGIPGRLRRCR